VDMQLTDEQTWLSESAAELAARAPEEQLWSRLVEFGALDVTELGAVELVLIARTLGEQLAATPFVDSAAVAYALSEPGGTATALCQPLEPPCVVEDGRLSGESAPVVLGAAVELLAVGVTGPALAFVRSAAPGVELTPEDSLDLSLAPHRLRCNEVEPERVEPGVALDELAAVAAVLAGAEAVGAAAAVLELARDYAAQRRQFGRTIGSFQAVRHLLADMYVGVESSWSSVLYAAAALDEREAERLQAASVAKAYTSRATRDVAHAALQVFGGIAFTAEHPAHRFLRRILARAEHFGNSREHERSLGRSLARQLEVLA
jgi:alkylation response protein AidB-like acyl-CoA dehydrogenase